VLRQLVLDGSASSLDDLVAAVAGTLDGGPAVLPLEPGASVPTAGEPDPGTAVVIRTSGSSGEPKLVQLPAAALRASAEATAPRLGGPGRWLLALPGTHVAGVQVIVRSLLAGYRPVLQDPRGGFRPAGFAAATAELAAEPRRYTSLVPTQLLRLLDAGGAALAALRSYHAVLVGGAALDALLAARAHAAGVRVVTTYGMSETAGGCVYDGTPLDGVRVRLDPDGGIGLGGPTLASGYLGRPDLTASAFADGWFRTGDHGRFRDGRLEVLGRLDEMIITGGEKVPPAAVERVLLAQPGVRAACVVGLPDPEWGQLVAAAVVVDPAVVPDLDRLPAAVRAALGRAAGPRRVRTLPEIPLLGIGKPDRAKVAELLAEPNRSTG